MSAYGREICYGLPACIAVVSVNPELPAWGDGSALFGYPDALVLPNHRDFSGSTCSWGIPCHNQAVVRPAAVLLPPWHRGALCGRPNGHFFLPSAASVSHSFWHFPFLYYSQLIFLSIYCRKALREVLCFAWRVFIPRKLQVLVFKDCRGGEAHISCSYSCVPRFCTLTWR